MKLNTLVKEELGVLQTLKREKLTTLQVNLGNLCNQACLHCHIQASPQGKNIMTEAIIGDILNFLKKNSLLTLDITGGAPELNPHFKYLVRQAKPLVEEVIVRSNLTVLLEREELFQFFKKYHLHIIASLPCYLEENVDYQRGKGVFKKSIEALRRLNKVGYGKDDLKLDLVYNPREDSLPPSQEKLEGAYKKYLKENFDIVFNHLLTITNVPITRFKKYLEERGRYNSYLELLKKNFNPQTQEAVMCREYISVDYLGRIYDCDFNQALGWYLEDKAPLKIGRINREDVLGKEIKVGDHCFACFAGAGSSCRGSLVEK